MECKFVVGQKVVIFTNDLFCWEEIFVKHVLPGSGSSVED